jgi:hypothetical protein
MFTNAVIKSYPVLAEYNFILLQSFKIVLIASSYINLGVPAGTFLCLPAKMLYAWPLLLSMRHMPPSTALPQPLEKS